MERFWVLQARRRAGQDNGHMQTLPCSYKIHRQHNESAMDQLFGEFVATRTPMKSTREKAKDEILKYRERDPLELSGDVLQWWKKQADLPLLSSLAKDYLSIPATSVSSERVFSSAGNIVTAERSLLHPDHVDQLIFLKKNLKKTHLG